MKTEACLLILALGLIGCSSSPKPSPANPPPPPPLDHAITIAPAGVRMSETIKSYTLGAYVDPDDPNVRHDAHMIQRVEAPTRWNLRAAPPSAGLPQTPIIPPSSMTPEPVAPPHIANNPPPAPAVAPTVIVTPIVPPAPPPSLPPVPPQAIPPEPALMPNTEGIIDLAAAAYAASGDESEKNPFAVRTAATAREITLHVTGLFGGATPCVVINERVLQPGEVVESFTVVRIETNAVLLRHGEHRLRVPVSDQPVRVRL